MSERVMSGKLAFLPSEVEPQIMCHRIPYVMGFGTPILRIQKSLFYSLAELLCRWWQLRSLRAISTRIVRGDMNPACQTPSQEVSPHVAALTGLRQKLLTA
jgi:hypothetical protein